MDIPLLAFALVFALAYANGTNDVSKAIATLVGSGVTHYQAAIIWGTIWTTLGAGVSAFVASAMVKTFSQGLIQTGTIVQPVVGLAVLTGAMAWILFASRTGLPVSTTHALTGAIVGTGLMAFAGETLIWPAIEKKIAPAIVAQSIPRAHCRSPHPSPRTSAGRAMGRSLRVCDAGIAGVSGHRCARRH